LASKSLCFVVFQAGYHEFLKFRDAWQATGASDTGSEERAKMARASRKLRAHVSGKPYSVMLGHIGANPFWRES
jgi:hypothetical protein